MKELNNIGFPWDYGDSLWEGFYKWVKKHFDDYGHITVPKNVVVEELGRVRTWIYAQRTLIRNNLLPADKAEKFKAIDKRLFSSEICAQTGIYKKWFRQDYWYNYYYEAKKYYEDHGYLEGRYHNIRYKQSDPSAFNIKGWISQQRVKRQKGLLSDKQIKLLDSIGMVWEEKEPGSEIDRIHAVKLKKRSAVLYKTPESCTFPRHYKIIARYKRIETVIRNTDKYDAVITGNVASLGKTMAEAVEAYKSLEQQGLRFYFVDYGLNSKDSRVKSLVSYLQAMVEGKKEMAEMISDGLRKRRSGWKIIDKTLSDFESMK